MLFLRADLAEARLIFPASSDHFNLQTDYKAPDMASGWGRAIVPLPPPTVKMQRRFVCHFTIG
jgi:hypothetical protein